MVDVAKHQRAMASFLDSIAILKPHTYFRGMAVPDWEKILLNGRFIHWEKHIAWTNGDTAFVGFTRTMGNVLATMEEIKHG